MERNSPGKLILLKRIVRQVQNVETHTRQQSEPAAFNANQNNL